MTQRTLTKDLAASPDGPVIVSGWVDTVRDQKKVQFVVLRDESGAVQLVHPRVLAAEAAPVPEPGSVPEPVEGADPAAHSGASTSSATDTTHAGASTSSATAVAGASTSSATVTDPIAETISSLAHGTFLTVRGELKHDERVKLGGVEVKVESIEVTAPAEPETPIADDSSIDKRLDWRFLDLRVPANQLIFRAQTTLEHAWRTYWVERDFIEIHTPKLMASASESRAELFEVGYFEGTAYLAQSPQFFKQMAQPAGFGKVFEIAPAFRADPSFTSRHATEFTSVDAEISWIDSHDDVMRMHEELMVAGITAVKERHGDAIERELGVTLEVPSTPFPRIPLAEAKRIVAERGYTVPRDDADMDPEGERQIAAYVREELGHDFVFLTDYDSSIRPFYHMRHEDDPHLTKSYDLIYHGVEISTGAQREHRVDVLVEQAREKGLAPEELDFYLDFFRHGVPPHGGFGMGLARVLMLMLGRSSIRETTYLFRGPNRLLP